MSKFDKFLIILVVAAAFVGIAIWNQTSQKKKELAGGIRIVLQAKKGSLVDETGKALPPDQCALKMNAVVKTIEMRLNKLGVMGYEVKRQDTDLVIAEFPRMKNKDEVLKSITDTSRLEFYWLRYVESPHNHSAEWKMLAPETDKSTGLEIYSFRNKATGKIIIGDTPIGQQRILKEVVNAYDPVLNPNGDKPMLTGDDINPNAKADYDANGKAVMNVTFKSKGADIFATFTKQHIHERVAIFLGGKILTAPEIRETIPNGKAQISGFDSLGEAQNRATFINSGTLLVPLERIALQSIKSTR